VPPETKLLEAQFSIGVCAADHATNLKELLSIIESEPYPAGLVLRDVVIVGSGLDPQALSFVREFAGSHNGFILIEEPTRRGKAEAINRIIDSFRGQFLVLVNSDAHPESGAISRLLTTISRDGHVGIVSASPIVGERAGITGAVLQLIWWVHNECLLTLNEEDKNNHCCDELIVVRSEALRKLPTDTVNDGAFLAGAAYRAGYSIKFCETARVKIDVPLNFCDLLRQRRRIVYGHFQILRSVGKSPKTIESMLVDKPQLSLSILIRALAKSPRVTLSLPVAVIGEVISVALAIIDTQVSKQRHVPWERFGKRA
jgi:cellulose synthase/poly-beta-1,6-N-acetylglucosamine synthase-like glycosyltransferase